ncbi:MAG: polysaccharide deacetylase family protein [Myxococcota bacterium]
MSRLGAISVDLDSLPHYCRIQGVDEQVLDARARSLVGDVAIPRFLELLHRARVPATFFVIGADVAQPGMKEALVTARGAGVELASHSFAHDYAISRRAPEVIARDLEEADQAIEAATGARPVGFRAPGYTLSPVLLSAVAARGYQYDSSTYPATPYYLLKAGVMGALAAVGRPSRAILDSPRVLFAPRTPYRPSLAAPYARGDAPLIELPMSVAPVTRVPFIGTFATMAPWAAVELTFRTLSRDELFNFELHAIDVLDVSDGIPEVLARQQRDVKIPARKKLARLRRLFSWLAEDRRCVTLADAARELAPLV